jgi:hypothetical protein
MVTDFGAVDVDRISALVGAASSKRRLGFTPVRLEEGPLALDE